MTQVITERQLEIIEATGKILTQKGVNGLTIKNLANEMDFSESAIYRHFASKDKIIIAMLHYVIANVDLNIETQYEVGTETKLKIYLENHFTYFSQNPHLVVAIFSDGLLEVNQEINNVYKSIIESRKKYMEPLIIKGQDEGLFITTVSASTIVDIIMGSLRLQMYKWRINQFQFDILKEGNMIIQSLMILIKTK